MRHGCTIDETAYFEQKEDATMYIYNMFGNVVKQIFMSQHVNSVIASVEDLTPGIYSYGILVADKKYNGKLSILK